MKSSSQPSMPEPLQTDGAPAPRPNKGGRPPKVRVWSKPERNAVSSRLRNEIGMGRWQIERAQQLHAGDPLKQLKFFFDNFSIRSAIGRKRGVAQKTERKYFMTLNLSIRTLSVELNMRIRNLSELSTKHLRALTLHWERQGYSASALQSLNTAFRRVGIWMGKPDLAPSLGDLVANPASAFRHSSSSVAKSWEAKQVNPETVFAAMEKECPATAALLRSSWTFGFRVEEQLQWRPEESHKGDMLYITRGTKGGRVREVRILADWEREVLEQAKAIARLHPQGIVGPLPARTLAQAKDHYYYLCRKIGLSGTGAFGITPHGARHSFALRRYEIRAGLPAPVLGGAMPSREIDQMARQEGSLELGHGRRSATAGYTGTVYNMTQMDKKKQRRLEHMEAVIGGDAEMLQLASTGQLLSFCLVGDAAGGEPITSMIAVFLEAAIPIQEETRTAVLRRVAALLGQKCICVDRNTAGLGDVPVFEIVALGRAGAAHRDAQARLAVAHTGSNHP